MASPPPEEAATPQVVFRGKKRKAYRQRSEQDEEPRQDEPARASDAPTPAPETSQATAQGKEKDEVEDGPSLSDVVRLRNARKSRLKGVTFSADAQSRTAEDGGEDDELSLMIREEETKVTERTAAGVTKRFAPQTGLTGELVNKHMEDYIEAELARRRAPAGSGPDASSSSLQSPEPQPQNNDNPQAAPSQQPQVKRPQGQVTMHGQLMEIDLGDEARTRTAAMTDLARRRLLGERVEDEEQSGRPAKVRLGRDGKPWRPRNRRGSDAIKRDQLVEEILRENRLDVYDTPKPQMAAAIAEPDGAADDRLAEEFQREFMEAMAQRQQKKPTAPPARSSAKKDEEVLKGPKLGGSRNARAAMRDLLLKQEREKETRR